MGCIITETEHTYSALTSLRPRRAGPFQASQVQLLRLLRPHLEKTVQFHLTVQQLDGQRRAMLEALDRLPTGVILLADTGRVVVANRAAQQILSQNDGFTATMEGLAASNAGSTRLLKSMIAKAALTARSQSSSEGGSLGIDRPSGNRAFSVIVMPVSRQAFEPEVRGTAVIVFVRDPEAKVYMNSEVLTRIYGLTGAESRLAIILMQGVPLVHAAQRLRVSHNTARTHLRKIYEKTGTHHQGELVRLLLTNTLSPHPFG